MTADNDRLHFALGRACALCKLSLKLHRGCPVLEKKDSPEVALRNSQIGVWTKRKTEHVLSKSEEIIVST